jgi:hypothetical protein
MFSRATHSSQEYRLHIVLYIPTRTATHRYSYTLLQLLYILSQLHTLKLHIVIHICLLFKLHTITVPIITARYSYGYLL